MIPPDRNITIAILPFQVMDSEENIKFLIDGFTNDLTINLSKFIGLSVISHFSTSNIHSVLDHNLIKKLNANFLVSGSVRHINDNLRISIQLIKSEDKSIVFSGNYDEPLNSLLQTQDSIINQIVSVLKEKINTDILSHSYKKQTVELAAYENYLRGMDVLYIGTEDSDVKARSYFNAALKINPHYSLAYTGLSLSYFNFWSCRLWSRWDISKKGAYKYALKALEINPSDYIALGVLGRNYLYLGEFEKAEHCLRKSLLLNSNDTSHLLRVAFSLMFLGYAEESIELYLEATRLNPFHGDKYFAYGSNFYLGIGDFKRSIELSRKTSLSTWTDFPAWIAVAYLQLNDLDSMWENWNLYLKQFESSIYSGKKTLEEEALEWLFIINPFKGKSLLEPLADYIKKEKGIKTFEVHTANSHENKFFLKEKVWELEFNNQNIQIKDAKGLHTIYKLLQNPYKDFHCLDLMDSKVKENSVQTIDHKAKSAYLNRIRELQLEIDEAESFNQLEKIATLREEYDSILDHLSNSLSISGKARKIESTSEKARSAITWRIRNTIKKINQSHEDLASHLSSSLKTGTFCSYKPSKEMYWEL